MDLTARPTPAVDSATVQAAGRKGWMAGDVHVPAMSELPPLPSTATPPAGATVARSLRNFQLLDPNVCPPGAAPEIKNFWLVAPGVFACVLRHRKTWHDGDRDICQGKYATKSRAEMCCLGGPTPYVKGGSYLIGTTVWLRGDFVPAAGYCNFQQPTLHATYTTAQRLEGNNVITSVMAFERGLGSRTRVVRTFSVPRGQWTSWVIRIQPGRKSGRIEVSVNGDKFTGITLDTTIGHVHADRVGVVDKFGGTWGIYESTHKNVDSLVIHAYPWWKRE